MHSGQLVSVIRHSAGLLNQDYDGSSFSDLDLQNRSYNADEVDEFKRDLIEAANQMRIIYLDNSLDTSEFVEFLEDVHIPILAFEKDDSDKLSPVIFSKSKRKLFAYYFDEEEVVKQEIKQVDVSKLYLNLDGKIDFLGVFSYKSMVSDDPGEEGNRKLTPVKRLFKLLSEEKKDILYIYIYAVLIGLISLTLPLGIQATVSLISGGVFFSSVYVLIALVIVGVLAAGGLQVMQITLVEFLQRRVFTKAAFEFAFRVPRIKGESLHQYYAPELMNRFFDVLTIQKGLPKLLIDLSAGVIQIIFGLLLLSFYHPFFVFFGLILITILLLVFYFTGPKGLSSSINESKHKYKVVYWLEEIARTINSFKLSGNTALPMRKTDYNVNNYLKNRKVHFNVLISQYMFVLLFKALVTGGLLIIGTVLVVQREITLGQFVASEVIIILTLNSVEKIIMYMDVVYDMLTAVDKIANVTDLPLEKSGGFDFPYKEKSGFNVRVKDLNYHFQENGRHALRDINLEIKAGAKICISGPGGSGKTVLVNTLSGLNMDYKGIITMNGYSLRDLDLNNLRDKIGKNVSQEDIFEGTIMENILLAKPHAKPSDAIEAINQLNINDEINGLPNGLETSIVSGGKGLSNNLVNKIILARCLAKKPNMLVLNDFFDNFYPSDRMKMVNEVTHNRQWTMLAVSNDPMIMEACDKVILMENGYVREFDSFESLETQGKLDHILKSDG